MCAFRAPRVLSAAVIVAISGVAANAQLVNGVASGDTTQNSTVLWARSLTSGNLSFEVSTDPTFASGVSSYNVAVGADTLVPAKANVTGLNPGTQYYYRATDAGGAALTGTFKTPHAQGNRAGMRFGVSGDWRGDVGPYPFARNVPGRNLDLWVSLGDTIYADVASPEVNIPQAQTLSEFRRKHSEIYTARGGLNTLADLRGSTSVLATIDDHEVTNDFAGHATVSSDSRFNFGGAQPGDRINTTPLYNNGLQAFQDYHPVQNSSYSNVGDSRTDGRPELYRSRTYGADASIFVLDSRSFRDQSIAPVANPLDTAQVQNFIGQAWNPTRTMLGNRQFQQLATDLLQAQQTGVTWKFVHIPEPIQNLGIVSAQDRFEGYAAERAALLNFIKTNNIENVVFVAADIHGTVVNNVTYQTNPLGPQIQSGAWEITTGSGAYAAPFGPTVAGLANQLGLPGALPLNVYLALPAAQQEAYVQGLINAQVLPLGYDAVGLDGSGIPATLLQGGWTATNTYGWTEFDIDQLTQALTVTTYGIPWYPAGTDPALLAGLQPQIVQQFVVQAVPAPAATLILALGGALAARRRRR